MPIKGFYETGWSVKDDEGFLASEGGGCVGGPSELALVLREHSAAVMRYTASLAKRMSLEVSELAALEHVQAAGPIALGRLARRLSMSAGAVTTLVDRLEAKGYVERRPNPADRRSSLVAEREEGVAESLRHLGPFIREMREVEERLTEEEREVVLRYLRAVTEATHRHARIDASEEAGGGTSAGLEPSGNR